jgi:hypothetical protein
MGNEKSEFIEPQKIQGAGEFLEPGTFNRMQEARLTAGQQAALDALKEIRARSFSGRHPELGRMINCQVCDRRHRESEHHEQKFTTRWTVVDGKKVYTDEQLIAGKTPETETVIEEKKVRLTVGASVFKGKRKHPPLNKRSNEFVQLVRYLLPDEYTHEELEDARRQIKAFLAKKYGRYGFLPPLWQVRKQKRK